MKPEKRFELQHKPGEEYPWIVWDCKRKSAVAQFEAGSEDRARMWLWAFKEERQAK